MESVAQTASVFQSPDELSRLHPSLRLPGGSEDYELVACSPSDRVTGDPGPSCFFLYETILTRVKLELPFPQFYCGILSILRVAPIHIHPND